MTSRYFFLALILISALSLACSQSVHKHEKQVLVQQPDDFPRKIYVGNQVNSLNTRVELPTEKRMYIEVTKKDGLMERGNLIRITEEELIVSGGFRYSTVNDSLVKVERKINIPKEDVLILKVW